MGPSASAPSVTLPRPATQFNSATAAATHSCTKPGAAKGGMRMTGVLDASTLATMGLRPAMMSSADRPPRSRSLMPIMMTATVYVCGV